MSPARIVGCHADYERADRDCRGRPPGTPPLAVVPLTCDQPPVPGEQRRRGHRIHLTPAAAGNQPRQRRQPQPVGWLVADPADLAAQDRVLVPEHQDFGVLGHPVPRQHRQAAEQAAYEQVEDGNDHSAMIPAGKPDQARSNNRAPQVSPLPRKPQSALSSLQLTGQTDFWHPTGPEERPPRNGRGPVHVVFFMQWQLPGAGQARRSAAL